MGLLENHDSSLKQQFLNPKHSKVKKLVLCFIQEESKKSIWTQLMGISLAMPELAHQYEWPKKN